MYVRTRKKNRRKAAILGVLARASGPLSYAQVARAVGIYPIRQVARDLQRYTRFGYVRRWKAAGKYRYEITRRGAERLAYFNRSRSRKP
jgi:DNA-binding IclR family transcriptional regulator